MKMRATWALSTLPAEGELTVYDIAGVEVGQVAVFRHLQIELLAVKVRHVGGALYVVGAGTGGERTGVR